jgi:hypothetical protein
MDSQSALRDDYTKFLKTWYFRAKRQDRVVDEADRFICLWIAFNSWLRQHYGEDWSDSSLIGIGRNSQNGFVNDSTFIALFESFKNDKRNKRVLDELKSHGKIYNLRYPRGTPGADLNAVAFTGDFRSYMEAVYQIRCNLFHGRKDPEDKTDEGGKISVDYKLIRLAYDTLLPFFERLCESMQIHVEYF